MELTLVVLAAGIGSRYGGIKQMEPVGPSGEFILDYSVFDALREGFGRVVFVIGKAIAEPFRAAIGDRVGRRADVAYVVQSIDDLPAPFAPPPGRVKPWGTGHAVLACAGVVRSPFAVINADDFYGRRAYAALAGFLDRTARDPAACAMVGFRLGQTVPDAGSVSRGLCRADAGGNLVEIVERTRIEREAGHIRCEEGGGWRELTGNELVSMNFWGFKPAIFEALGREFGAFLSRCAADLRAEFYIPVAMDALIRGGNATCRVLSSEDAWFGVTNPGDKAGVVARIASLVAAGEYPRDLWSAPA